MVQELMAMTIAPRIRVQKELEVWVKLQI
jgi:hypothetical protein